MVVNYVILFTGKIDCSVNYLERMIVLKNKTLKTVASAMVIAFGVTAMPLPAYAVSSNIVAETENVNTLTISQIQDLAAIYNDGAEQMRLSMKQLELNQQMLRNQRRNVMDSLNSTDKSSLEAMEAMIENIDQQLATETDPSQIASLTSLRALWTANLQSASMSMYSGVESALAGLDTIDDNLDTMSDTQDDLNKSMADLEKQMRYTAAALSLNAIQLEKAIVLVEEQIALTERSVQIAELQQALGMNISTDVTAAKTSLVEAKKTLADQQETLSVIKRSINILIGRNAGNPLEIVPMNLPIAIDPAPAYTTKLVDKFIDNSYSLKTLERDKVNLKDSVKDDMGSDEKQSINYQVLAKDVEIDNKKQAIEDDLKAMLAKINSDGQAYRVSREKYENEQKKFEFMQKKYELGMISELALRQAELSLKSVEMTNMQNGYQHYLNWQKYYLAEKGVDVSSLGL